MLTSALEALNFAIAPNCGLLCQDSAHQPPAAAHGNGNTTVNKRSVLDDDDIDIDDDGFGNSRHYCSGNRIVEPNFHSSFARGYAMNDSTVGSTEISDAQIQDTDGRDRNSDVGLSRLLLRDTYPHPAGTLLV